MSCAEIAKCLVGRIELAVLVHVMAMHWGWLVDGQGLGVESRVEFRIEFSLEFEFGGYRYGHGIVLHYLRWCNRGLNISRRAW